MKTLISYVYFETAQSIYNLTYFVKHGLFESDDVTFIIVINGHECSVKIPEYDNVSIIYRDNIGFDFGGHAEVLNNIQNDFDYYIFLNGSVIGPFVPVYYRSKWPTVFTDRFTEDIKLVGTTIVCLPAHDDGGYGPRIEGFCFALDAKGLEIVLQKGTIFVPHKDKYNAIINGEYNLSKTILDAGFNIDCLLLKYNGIDWRDKNNWTLNNNQHPSRQGSYDGISIHPLEVVFHKWYWSHHPSALVSFKFVEKYCQWA